MRGRYFYTLLIFVLGPVFLFGQSRASAGNGAERVIRFLTEASLAYEERSLLASYGGFGSSIIVRSETDNNENRGTFVLAVPLEAEFAVDTALALAEKAVGAASPVNIITAFLGDEKSELPEEPGGIPHKGLRDLLTLADMPENWLLCYLDADARPRGLVINHGARGYIAPLDIVKPLPSLFSARNIPLSFRIRFNEIYKLGLAEGHEAQAVSWEEEINSFALSGREERVNDRDGSAGEEKITPEDLAALLHEYSFTLPFPLLEADMHYSIFDFPGGNIFFVSEGLTAFLLLFTAGITLFLFLLYSARNNAILIFYTRLFFRHIWIFFLFLPLLVLSIKTSGYFYSLFYSLFNRSAPGVNYAGLLLAVLLAFLFFFSPSPLLHFIRFPRRAQFYGISAVFFVTAGMITALLLDFSYVSVFLWAFFFVFLGALTAKPALIFLCVLMLPLFASGALFNIYETGSGRLTGLILSPHWDSFDSWGAAVQAALFSLPIFLLIKRGSILAGKSMRRAPEKKPERGYRLITLPLLMVLIFVSMMIQILLLPGAQLSAERRDIHEDTEAGEGTERILDISLDDTIFQDSRILTLYLGAKGNPLRFNVSLESGNGSPLLPLYSAPVPFEREENGEMAGFVLGERAPNPLVLEIVVPLKFDALLRVEAVYNTWDPAVDPGGNPGTDDYVLRVSKSLPLADLIP